MTRNVQNPVPTTSLLAYLLTILAWQVEAAVLVVHVCTDKRLDPFGHAALLAISASLTLFSVLRGKQDYRNLQPRGPISLTRSQTVIIFVFVIAVCCVFALIAERLIEH